MKERRFWRPDVRQDVDDELAHHLEMREREYLARGLTPDEAREAAQRKFGNAERVAAACRDIDERRYRDERRASMWNDFRQDVAYGVRLLGRAPGFTAVAVLTLALGIGATTAIFSVIDAALLRALPYPKPEQLVNVTVNVLQRDGQSVALAPSVEDVDIWRRDHEIFSHIAVWRPAGPVVVDGPEPERLRAMKISEDYLALHGVKPFLGRAFGFEDIQPGAAPVVVLGHAYWQRRFGGDRAVLGQAVRIDDVPATVVGILPAWFHGETALWQPLQVTGRMRAMRGTGASVYARLQPGASPAQAEQRLSGLLAVTDPVQNQPSGVQLTSLYEYGTSHYRPTILILSTAVVLILLIACLNAAALLLARGATRGPELGVRASLGAGRSRLIRQLLAESLVLSLLGGAAGVLLAWLSFDGLVANIPDWLPSDPPALNLRVLGFALAVSIATGVVFGLVPALRMSRVTLTNVLSRAVRGHAPALTRRSGQALIATEVALAIVLVAAGALMVRSFAKVLSVDVGFNPAPVITMEVTPVDTDTQIARRYYPALVATLRQQPGIEAVGAVDHVPLAGSSTGTMGTVGGRSIHMNIRHFVPGYFEAIGFGLVSGRFPSATDTAGLPVAVINATAATQMFPDASPLGETFQVAKHTYQVIGVARDVRHRGPLDEVRPEVFLPYGLPGSGERPLMIVVRSTLPMHQLEPLLRDAATTTGKRVVVERIRRGSDLLADRVATPRQRTILLSLLGSLGLVLALVGIFGTTAHAVGRRTQEIGVRMALGARPQQVVAAVLRDSLWPTAIGVAVGLGVATLTTRVIASFLFNTEPTDPATFAAVAVVMILTATLAAWLPARRAARVDPVEALRVG